MSVHVQLSAAHCFSSWKKHRLARVSGWSAPRTFSRLPEHCEAERLAFDFLHCANTLAWQSNPESFRRPAEQQKDVGIIPEQS
jgi:hypothetical protein